MSNVAEFVEVRKNVEALATEIALCIKNKAKQESLQHLAEAKRNLEILKTMVANDVQVVAVGRLSTQLANLEAKTSRIKAGSSTRKRSTAPKTKTEDRAQIDEPPHIVVFERP